MKFFCLFFSVYILLLSLVPCEELAAKADFYVDETSQIAPLQPETENCDDCSPFCNCSCCPFSVVYQFKAFTITTKIIVSDIPTRKISYQNPYSQVFKTSIWQPPKFDSIG